MGSVCACGRAPDAAFWPRAAARAASASPADDRTTAAVLPAEHRLRTSDEFRSVVRQGVRAGRHALVVRARATPTQASRAGFVVSKAVGNAVTRNRVKRQLRHLVAGELAHTPIGVAVVVRALPPAAAGHLAEDLGQAWASALGKLGVTR